LALREVGDAVRQGAREMIERVMEAEIELFLGRDAEAGNKRNGYSSRTFGNRSRSCLKRSVTRRLDIRCVVSLSA
jgi:transposase-like protein